MERCSQLMTELAPSLRVELDASDKSPGWKFAEHEMKGVPIRLELGPKDIENGQAVLVRRDTSEKRAVPLDGILSAALRLLDEIQSDMLRRATDHRRDHTYAARTYEEFSQIADNQPGFIKAMWCGDTTCELRVKDELAVTARCIPFEQEPIDTKCIVCGTDSKHMVVWGKAY